MAVNSECRDASIAHDWHLLGSGTLFSGTPLAFMWHGASIAGAVFPAGAVHGIEQVLIALTGSWQSVTEVDGVQHLVSDHFGRG